MKKVSIALLFFLCRGGYVHAHILSFLKRKPAMPQLIFVTPEKALRVRILLGLASGFFPNLFFATKTYANISGLTLLSSASYTLNKKGFIIKNERDMLDVGNAYIVGMLGGILVRSMGVKAKEIFDRMFDKPEARVVLVDQSEEKQLLDILV